MTPKPTSKTLESRAESRSLIGLMTLMVLTNGWFFTQMMAYSR